MRVLKKTCSFSVLHLVVAVAVAWALTRDLKAALAIGLLEPVVQTVAFAAHERAWSRARAVRPLMKTGTYSLAHLAVAVSVAYAVTLDLRAALAVGLIEPLVQTLAYHLHERLWARRAGAPLQPCGHRLALSGG
jgi:uncharacterized membrane protein